jgi:hypothetical protein
MSNWVEREEDSIQRDFEEGLISSEEAARSLRDLHAEVEAEAREKAEQAHDDYIERW